MADKFSIEERIAHFLRLAEDKGATQAERDTAATQAERLMLKHAIDRAMLDGVGEQRKERIIVGRVRVDGGGGTYSYHAMRGMVSVANAMGLTGYYEDFSKIRAGVGIKPHINICFAGYESDVKDAVDMVNSLLLQAMVAMKSWWKNLPSYQKDTLGRQGGYHARCEFISQFGAGAARRIQDEREQEVASVAGSEIVLFDRSREVQDWADSNLGLTYKMVRRTSSPFGRSEGYAAGREANTGRSSHGIGQGRGISA